MTEQQTEMAAYDVRIIAENEANGTTPAPVSDGKKREPPPSALALRQPSWATRHPTLEKLLKLVRLYAEAKRSGSGGH